VIQVLAIVLNAKTDTQNLRALLRGVRVKDKLRNKLELHVLHKVTAKIEVSLQSC